MEYSFTWYFSGRLWSDTMFLEPRTMRNSWKTRPKNASGITSREMLLNGSETLAFVQGKSLWNHLELRNIPQVNGMCWYLVVQFLVFRHTSPLWTTLEWYYLKNATARAWKQRIFCLSFRFHWLLESSLWRTYTVYCIHELRLISNRYSYKSL